LNNLKNTIKWIIPSRRRAQWCSEAVKLFPQAAVCIGEDDLSSYQEALPPSTEFIVHPDSIVGLGRLRKWIAENVRSRILIQVNDDVLCLRSMVGRKSRCISEASRIKTLVENACSICDSLGIGLFSFASTVDPRRYTPMRPFYLCRIDCAFFGMIGRPIEFDENVNQLDDLDASLQALMLQRIVWCDTRFGVERRNLGGMSQSIDLGGNAVSRSKAGLENELAYLKRKWGGAFIVKRSKSQITTQVCVRRQQEIKS